jgi:hypothetical protein
MFASKVLCAVAAVAIQSLNPGLHAGRDIKGLEAGVGAYADATPSDGGTESQELTPKQRAEYERVIAYLAKADLLRLVDGAITPHGSGASFGVTFAFASDDKSRTDILAILQDTAIFDIGGMGSRHAKSVGATVRADAYDFRSRNGVLGRESLEVMINHKTLRGYADIDRYDLYGGIVPASAHILIEFLPDKMLRTLFLRKSE